MKQDRTRRGDHALTRHSKLAPKMVFEGTRRRLGARPATASGELANPKAWKEIWGSGQGVGGVGKVVPATEMIARLKREYEEATDAPL
jgi:NAD(P)H-dependent flavin oxidoreductase YrpB (nitropropane dioxygenase family)